MVHWVLDNRGDYFAATKVNLVLKRGSAERGGTGAFGRGVARGKRRAYVGEADNMGVERGASLGVEGVEAHMEVSRLLLGRVFLRLLTQRVYQDLVLTLPLKFFIK